MSKSPGTYGLTVIDRFKVVPGPIDWYLSGPTSHNLADFRAIASRIMYYLTELVLSLQGAWKQATRRRLLHGAKADGVGG